MGFMDSRELDIKDDPQKPTWLEKLDNKYFIAELFAKQQQNVMNGVCSTLGKCFCDMFIIKHFNGSTH